MTPTRDVIIAVDIGNTAVKLAGYHDVTGEMWTRSIPLRHDNWLHRCDEGIDRWTGDADAGRTEPDRVRVRIASVNSAAARRLLDHWDGQRDCRLITFTDVPIRVQTDAPEKVGIDRVLGAWGASRQFPGPMVVVDAGTTVTVDLVDDDHAYRGGAILPGLDMQTRALASGTDGLPELDWRAGGACPDASSLPAPAQNTADAIRLGVLACLVGGVSRLVRLYGNPPTIVMTGGDARCLAPPLMADYSVHIQRELVCQSLLSLETP